MLPTLLLPTILVTYPLAITAKATLPVPRDPMTSLTPLLNTTHPCARLPDTLQILTTLLTAFVHKDPTSTAILTDLRTIHQPTHRDNI